MSWSITDWSLEEIAGSSLSSRSLRRTRKSFGFDVVETTIFRSTCRSLIWRITRSEEHTSELQSRGHLVCRLLLEKKKKQEMNNDSESTRHDSKHKIIA